MVLATRPIQSTEATISHRRFIEGSSMPPVISLLCRSRLCARLDGTTSRPISRRARSRERQILGGKISSKDAFPGSNKWIHCRATCLFCGKLFISDWLGDGNYGRDLSELSKEV